MITDIGVFPALDESRSTITKSSITPENTSTALAKMAGASSGSRTRRITWNWLAPRSAAASSYCRPSVTSLACTTMAGQLTFQVTSPRTSAVVPRCTVVSTDSRTVWMTAACSCGLCSTELTGSLKYQRQENPCQVDCDRPLLNENKTAITIGTSDQTRYSQVNPSRNHGCPHGLRQGVRRRAGVAAAVGAPEASASAAGAGAGAFVAVIGSPPCSSRSRSRPW